MKKIVGYVCAYFQSLNKGMFLLATLLTALAVFCNYHYRLNHAISQLNGLWPFVAWYAVFFVIFSLGYALQALFLGATIFSQKKFLLLLLLAPAIFSWKMAYTVDLNFSSNRLKDEYWSAVFYWPFKVVVITAMLLLVHRMFDKGAPFYGVTLNSFSAKPYLIMLAIMVPLIAAASTQKDFLHMYPRMQSIDYLQQPGKGLQKILYQLSYGSDFFSIELFFRGFLVLAFARWAGKGAILPMAMFYCTIHFGKPLGECISSYFGGIILGIVSYHTRTILGGFMVHVGIAWLMELGGYLGQPFI